MTSQPLYRLVATAIEARIAEGHYVVDEPLPTEPELGREFGVSRITVRKALGQLKRKGLLFSRSGKGTIVRSDALVPHTMKITCSIADLTYYAQETSYLPIACETISATPYLAKHLRISLSDRVLLMTGSRGHGDSDYFAYEEIYVPEPFSAGISNANLQDRTIFGEIERAHGVTISEVRQALTAVMPEEKVRAALKLSNEACCLRAVRVYITRDGRPAQLAVVHYDSDRFEHTTVIYDA